MRAWLLLGLGAASPALASDGSIEVFEDAEPTFEPADDPEIEVRPSQGRERVGRAGRGSDRGWRTAGVSTFGVVWHQPSYPLVITAGTAIDMEFGWGPLSLRPNVALTWQGPFNLDAGLAAALRLSDHPERHGPLIGASGSAGWSSYGPRVMLGPELGWAANTDIRLRVAATILPRLRNDWNALGSPRPGILIELSARPHINLK